MNSVRWMPLHSAAVFFCLVSPVFAAETNIGGFVRDPAGKPIARAGVAIVAVTRDDAGQFLEKPLGLVRTDAAGKWSSKVPNLLALTFRLSHSDHNRSITNWSPPKPGGQISSGASNSFRATR